MKNIVQKISIAVPAMMLAASLATAKLTLAQGASSTAHQIALTAVPPRLGDDYTLKVAPGKTVQAAIQVRNPTDESITVETFARDFIVDSDGSTPIAVSPNGETDSRWALSQWIVVSPSMSVIGPRQTANIGVTISVPDNALPGGRYAMILHKPVTGSGSSNTTGAQITPQVGTLLYLIVDGPTTEDARISDFVFKGFNEMGPVPYMFTFENNSSLHVRPTNGKIVIRNMLGAPVDEIEIANETNVFPSSSRDFYGQWNKTWGFGKYTAELTADYGMTGKQVAALTTFWILPIRLILAVILVIILVAVVIISTRTKYSKMLEAEEEKVRKLDEKLKKARRR